MIDFHLFYDIIDAKRDSMQCEVKIMKKKKRRKDGRLQEDIKVGINYRTGAPILVRVYGYTEEELNEKVIKTHEKYVGISYGKLTLEGYLKNYIQQRWNELPDNGEGIATVEYYESLFKTYIYDTYIGRLSLIDFTTTIARDFIYQLQPQRFRWASGSSRTRTALYTILKTALKRAYMDELIEQNPLDRVRKPQHVPRVKGILNYEQMTDVLKRAKDKNLEMANLLAFDYNTVLRRGEIVALTFKHVDFKGSKIQVYQATKLTKKQGEFIGKPKTQYGRRELLMDGDSMDILQKQFAISKEKHAKLGIPFNAEKAFVFSDNKCQPFKLDFLTRFFFFLREEMHLPNNVSFHSLRHSAASNLAAMDIGAKKIQIRMGHASAAFSLTRYTHETSEMQQDVVKALNQREAEHRDEEKKEIS
jgi:integrase